jgi:hypothetical protein
MQPLSRSTRRERCRERYFARLGRARRVITSRHPRHQPSRLPWWDLDRPMSLAEWAVATLTAPPIVFPPAPVTKAMTLHRVSAETYRRCDQIVPPMRRMAHLLSTRMPCGPSLFRTRPTVLSTCGSRR